MARRWVSSVLGQRGQGLLEELHLFLVGPHDPEIAQRTGPQRGRGQAFGIAQGSRQRRRPLEVGVGQRGVAGPVLGLGESDQRVAARLGSRTAELLGHLQAAGEMGRRFLECEQAQRALARGAAVVDGLVRVGQGRSHGEVVGQLVDVGVQFVGMRPLRCDGDLVVVAHPPPA